jgi:hypothetical protein
MENDGYAVVVPAGAPAVPPPRLPPIFIVVPQGVGLIPIPFTGALAYLWALKDGKRQGLHDRAANTLVVNWFRQGRAWKRAPSYAELPAGPARARR